jgi:hypothetical protein
MICLESGGGNIVSPEGLRIHGPYSPKVEGHAIVLNLHAAARAILLEDG